MIFNKRETEEMLDAITIANQTLERLTLLVKAARAGDDVKADVLWDLKNFSEQIPAVLYNIHHEVYRRAQVPS